SDISDRHRTEGRIVPDGKMTVGMRPVDEAQKGPLGDSRGHILELAQTIEPQLAHAHEVVVAEAWSSQQLRQQCRATIREARQRGQRKRRGIGTDLYVVVR